MRTLALVVFCALFIPDVARAMCGCMLPPRPPPRQGEQKTARIINKSSKVILARDGDTTVMTLSNDFEGAPAEFGLVVPVPTVVKKEDVKIVEDAVFAALETASAPRITEQFEPDPCERASLGDADGMAKMAAPAAESVQEARRGPRAADFGVKVESHFFAGEYEIAVLAGKDSSGLVKWLQLFNYDVPDDAKAVLETYMKQNMHFFLARVFIKEMGTDKRDLRPIQVRYKTPKLMLPIRLGMVNADGPQELMVYALTKGARVETTTYRTIKMPSGAVLPHFTKDAWTEVYDALFTEQERREDQRVVFQEWGGFWQASSIDFKRAGSFWGDSAYLTRLHFRYEKDKFPEDLTLQITQDASPFAVNYTAMVPAPNACNNPAPHQARQREMQQLASLTGWSMEKVRARAGGSAGTAPPEAPKEPKWYEKIWK